MSSNICGLRRLRSAYASAQYNQGFHCPFTESGDAIDISMESNARMRLLSMRGMILNLCICASTITPFCLSWPILVFIFFKVITRGYNLSQPRCIPDQIFKVILLCLERRMDKRISLQKLEESFISAADSLLECMYSILCFFLKLVWCLTASQHY